MENNQKNAAEVQTSVPNLLPANYREKAEALGWVIDEDKVCGVFTFRQGSPAGEDYSFDLYADDDFGDGVAAAVRRVYEDFDVDEHVALFAEASVKGTSGVPKLSVLVEDAKEINEMEDVSQYSKRLAKLMQQELKDLQDGDVRRNRMYGRDIVASEMWRPDCRFFSDTKLPQDLPDMAVSVLVDQSGSMYGQRMGAAMKATMLLHDFAERVHVPVAVYGHNVTMHGRVNLFVYTDFLKAGKRDKYRLAKLSTGGCNRDGAALEVVANLLNARPERTKLLIIISDGKPNDDSYGGDSAAKDIKDIVARNRRRGVEIVAAAIGDDKEYLKKIYGDQFLDITDLSTFPKAMVKIVKKRLKV